MRNDEIIIGIRRRKIEDAIVARYERVRFDQRRCAWLEDEAFWDFVFSWYELAKYYEDSRDTAIGAHMLDLYMACAQRFREAAADKRLRERRRDKAADALYQINYYLNQIMIQVERNTLPDDDSPFGRIP